MGHHADVSIGLKLDDLFTSLEFLKGRAVDNVIIEPAWKIVKHEEVYLKAYESLSEAGRG